MNLSSNERTGLNVSPSAAEQLSSPQSAESAGLQPESATSAAEQAVAPGQPAAAAFPTIPLPVLPLHQPANDVVSTTQGGVPAVADDRDLIEKEWVDKAKKIIENNREDPYKQSNEMTVFKADYIEKRYNKEIKVSD